MLISKNQKALYSLLLIGILLNTAFSYTFNGNEIKDLINDDLADEIQSWSISKAINPKVLSTSCGGRNFFGGPGVLGSSSASSGESFSRSYKSLGKHNIIYFSCVLSVCGDWNADGIKLMFDSATVDRLEFNKKDFVAGKCGSAAGLSDIVVSGRIPHSANTLTFKAVSDCKKASSQVSFGIRDLSLIFSNCDAKDVKTEVCCTSATCSALSKNQCTCPAGSYMSTSSLTGKNANKCVPGHANCNTCFGPSESECYCCAPGTFFDGKTCCKCDDSCLECTGPGKCTKDKPVCIKDSKGNCVESCPAPLDLKDKKCTSKCGEDKFIFPDGSCDKTCPYKSITIGCYKLCVSPCKVGFIDCEGNCPTNCENPSKIRTDRGIAFCDYPCGKGLFYWESNKDKCVANCPEPWQCDKDKCGAPICSPRCDWKGKDFVWFKEENKCVCECPKGFTVTKLNGGFMCKPICPGKKFWEEGGEGLQCVSKCPEGWETKKDKYNNECCERKCCGDEAIWFRDVGKCVCECPKEGWKTDMVNKVPFCVPVCDCGKYWWEQGCEDGVGSCLDKCPDGWKEGKDKCGLDVCTERCCPTDKENIWSPAKKDCVCDCEAGWTKKKLNNVWVCVPACECDEFFWQDNNPAGTCVQECPCGWTPDKGCGDIAICSPKCCPTDKENIFWPEKKQCVCECGEGWIKSKVNDVWQCVRACECDQFWWQQCPEGPICVNKCPEGWKCDKGCEGVDTCSPQCCPTDKENIWWAIKNDCVCECGPGWVKSKVNGLLQCVPACECDEFWWCEGGKDGACVCECPEGWQCDKGCGDIPICSPKCKPTDKENVWWPEKKQCVCECGEGWVAQEVNGGLQCVKACPKGEYWWQECGLEGACVCECPEGFKCDKGCEGVDICSPKCPQSAKENIWWPEKKQCVCECGPGWHSVQINNIWQCAPICNCNELWWCDGTPDGACVEKCPDGWKCDKGCEGINVCSPTCPAKSKENIWFREKDDCVCECPDGWVKAEINDVAQCARACTCGEFWWPGCGSEGACVDKCPEGWKCDKGCAYVDLCAPQCPANAKENVWDPLKNDCVCDCADGYAPTLVNDVKQCAPICEKGQYWWAQAGKDGACVCECPSGWTWGTGCGGIDICVPVCDQKCPDKNFFELKSECIPVCPPGTKSAILNKVPHCVTICPKGELWWCEGTKDGACVHECPTGWKCSTGPGGIPICDRQCDPDSVDKVWFEKKGLCACDCPQGWDIKTANNALVCEHICEKGEYWWQAGGKDGACVCECPFPWKTGEGCDGVDICIPKCDPLAKESIFFNGQCVCECPCGWESEKVNDLAVCKKVCPEGQYWWAAAQVCVCECPDGWKCDKDDFGAAICVPQCDLNKPEKLWVPKDNCCKKTCPANTYMDTVNKVLMCVENCDS